MSTRISQNVERLAARARGVVDGARDMLAAAKATGRHDELVLYEDVALYILYDRFRAAAYRSPLGLRSSAPHQGRS